MTRVFFSQANNHMTTACGLGAIIRTIREKHRVLVNCVCVDGMGSRQECERSRM